MRLLAFLLASSLPGSAEEPWQRHTLDDSSQGADGVRLADVNGDGLMDIATGWEEGGIVRAYLHPGHAKAKEKWPAVTVGNVASPEDAVFADLDGDGAFDVISSCEGRTKSIFFHWAPRDAASFLDPNSWKTEKLLATDGKQAWMYALPLQIDGKNGPDLFVGSKGNKATVGWLQSPANPRDLAGWTYHQLQEAGWIMSLISVDLNHDTLPDLLVSDRRGKKRGIYWLENPGPGSALDAKAWKRHPVGGQNREIKFISHGDLDQDGHRDIIGIEKKSIVWYRLEKSKWVERVIPLPEGVGGGKSAAICDIDLDGKNDLVFSCEGAKAPLSGLRWLSTENSALNGPWISHEIAGPRGLKYDRLIPYDIDKDGDPDILCCEERDQLGVFWYENPHLTPPSTRSPKNPKTAQ